MKEEQNIYEILKIITKRKRMYIQTDQVKNLKYYREKKYTFFEMVKGIIIGIIIALLVFLLLDGTIMMISLDSIIKFIFKNLFFMYILTFFIMHIEIYNNYRVERKKNYRNKLDIEKYIMKIDIDKDKDDVIAKYISKFYEKESLLIKSKLVIELDSMREKKKKKLNFDTIINPFFSLLVTSIIYFQITNKKGEIIGWFFLSYLAAIIFNSFARKTAKKLFKENLEISILECLIDRIDIINAESKSEKTL